jgi:hypothetical protein
MARVASQSKNNARETPDIAQKIKQTVNSARLLIAVHVESENFYSSVLYLSRSQSGSTI